MADFIDINDADESDHDESAFIKQNKYTTQQTYQNITK